MENIPNDYKQLKIRFGRELSRNIDILTLESLKTHIRCHHLLIEPMNDNFMYSKQYKGQCSLFGKQGHSRDNCFKKNICEEYGNPGHSKDKLWKK